MAQNKSIHNDAVNYMTDEGDRRFETSNILNSTSSLGPEMIYTKNENEETRPLIGFESEGEIR